jgi:pimeloyl-ACP methyl ester carboxylesterase
MADVPEHPAALVARIDALATRRLTPCGVGSMVWRAWGRGRPLVLLHGASGSWTHWIRNVLPLAAHFHVLAPDMPGFGDSDLPPEPHTADMLADVIAAGLEAVVPPPEPFDMAGFSFGSIIAGLVAARVGGRLARLVLLGAGGLGLGAVPMPRLAQIEPGMTAADLERVHRHNLGALMIADPRNADDLAVHLQMENIRRARFKSGTIPISDFLLKALPSIRARLGGIWAERDAFMGPRAEHIAEGRRILASVEPDLDFRVIAGAGHWAIYEAADAANAALLDMLTNRDRFQPEEDP